MINIDFNTFFKQRLWLGWWWATPCPEHYYYEANCEVCDDGDWRCEKEPAIEIKKLDESEKENLFPFRELPKIVDSYYVEFNN